MYHTLTRPRNSPGPLGPRMPMSPWEKFVVVMVSAVLIVAAGWGAVLVWQSGEHYQAQVTVMQRDWDRGIGKPQGVSVARGQTAMLPNNLTTVEDIWDTCGKFCSSHDLDHYAVVYELGYRMDGSCYRLEPGNGTDTQTVSAITHGSGVYTLAFAPSGKALDVCAIGQRYDNDTLVLWSDHIPAAHG